MGHRTEVCGLQSLGRACCTGLGSRGRPTGLASSAKANTGNARQTSTSGHLICSGWQGAPPPQLGQRGSTGGGEGAAAWALRGMRCPRAVLAGPRWRRGRRSRANTPEASRQREEPGVTLDGGHRLVAGIQFPAPAPPRGELQGVSPSAKPQEGAWWADGC